MGKTIIDKTTSDTFNEDLRDLWDQYIVIQEQILKRKCAPISIDPSSVYRDGNKLYMTVDETRGRSVIEKIFSDRLRICNEDIFDDSVYVREDIWRGLSEDDILSIQKELASCYIKMARTPSINAKVFYTSNDALHERQMTLSEIRNLDKELRCSDIYEGAIDDSAACIVTLNVDLEKYYTYLFGANNCKKETRKAKDGTEYLSDLIEYTNQYIPKAILKEYYLLIGLRQKGYSISFTLRNPKAIEAMKGLCDFYDYTTGIFVFKRIYSGEEWQTNELALDVQNDIATFVTEARKYCTESEISFEPKFQYQVSNRRSVSHIFDMVTNIVYQHNNMSFNPETGMLGIDFNWRTDDISSIILELEKELPFVQARYHGDDHRFKCKFNTTYVGFDSVEAKLKNRFENVSVEDNAEGHFIGISIPLPDVKYYDKLRSALEYELRTIASQHTVKIDSRIQGKVKVLIENDERSRIEDLEESIRELRKADFGFDAGEKVIPFGKLISVNYPRLLFDVNLDPKEETAIDEYISSKSASFVVPILTGDIEKISRLKNTFSMATSGQNLLNENLQRFMFDASLATPTKDIEHILKTDGVAYNELNRHLLNVRINSSQKRAILKCMYAEDMAVIQGPPGTGKSTAIAELIWQLVRHGLKQGNRRERILLTSETNLAVDNAIARIVNNKTNLVKPIRFGGEEKLEAEGLQFSIELMKKWVEEGDLALVDGEEDEDTGNIIKSDLVLNNWLSNIANRSFYGLEDDDNEVITRWRRFLSAPSKDVRGLTYNRYVEACNVIGATCSSIGDRKSDGKGSTQFYRYFKEVFCPKSRNAKIEFTTVIQDESSKATPAELVLPFVYGKRAIVIGDHRQLPPMLDREEIEDSLDYALSIARSEQDRDKIERLQNFISTQFSKIEQSHFQRLYEGIDSSLKETFNLQYRMHPDINDVIKQFYVKDGGLNCGLIHPKDLGVNDHDMSNPASRYHGIVMNPLIVHNTHVVFVNTDSPEMLDGTSRVNYGEVEVISKLLSRFEELSTFKRYLDKFDKEEDKQIGIISFYGKQIKLIRAIANQHKNISTRVSTVDRFQGMERNIVIVSMVRSHIIQTHKNELPDYTRYKEYGYPLQHSLGFAQSPNRLNVALSRAKRLLIIVGNETLFSQHPIYAQLFRTIRSNPNNKVINQSEL